ncbi:hypothetical protein Tco_1134102 [Tanacetum coccineum]
MEGCNISFEVSESASDSSVNETEENNQVNDRFKKVEGYHAIPPPYTRNYIPSRLDLSFVGLDDSVYKTIVSETITSVPRNESTASKSSKDTLEQPKDVRPSAPIIEEWESDSDDDCVNSGLTGQREVRPIWNNAQRVNHQNKLTHPYPKRKFGPTVVATKSRLVPVNAAKQSSPRAATLISTARHVNTAASKTKDRSSSLNCVGEKGKCVKSSGMLDWRPTGKNEGIFDSGCSRHMTRNKSYLTDYQDIDRGFVAFAGSPKEGKITGYLTCLIAMATLGQAGKEKASDHEYILLPLMLSNSPLSSSTQSIDDKDADKVPNKGDDDVSQRNGQEKEGGASNKEADQHVQDFRAELDNFENINTGNPNINTASPIPNDSSMQSLENTGIFDGAYDDEDVGAEADLNNLETTMNASPIPTTRIHKDHPKD